MDYNTKRMSNGVNNKRIFPAALFPYFDGGSACFAMAEALSLAGMPVLAACAEAAVAEHATQFGYLAVSADNAKDRIDAALNRFLQEMSALPGVVLVDMSGGYTDEDVLRVAAALADDPGRLAIAARNSARGQSWTLKTERSIANFAFTSVHGRAIKDPWARLRGIPTTLIKELLHVKWSGRGFYINMLLMLHKNGIKVINIAVDATYNREPGAGAVSRGLDILGIVLLPLKYISVSLTVLLVDNLLFYLFFYEILHGNRPVSIAVGRFSGALVGYLLNRSVVFKHSGVGWRKELSAASKYAALVAFNYGAALGLNYLLGHMHIGVFIAKQLSDIILYVSTYLIQREVVFKKKHKP